jgi:hypothetical protein
MAAALQFALPHYIARGDGGPTAVSIDYGFLFVLGGAVGIAVASMSGAFWRSEVEFEKRFTRGIRSGAVAGLLGVLPAILVIEWFDAIKIVSLIILEAFALAIAAAFGSAVGASAHGLGSA